MESKPYPEFPGRYEVYPDGRVQSTKGSRRFLVGRINRNGYRTLCLWSGKKRVYRIAGAMVLETFVSRRQVGQQCCHYDGNRQNDTVTNLRWGTAKENAADRSRHGSQMGEKHGRSLTTLAQVQALKRLLAEGSPLSAAAKQVGIPYTRGWQIMKGNNWRSA